MNRASAEVSVERLSVPINTAFEFPSSVSKDEVVQVSLLEDFSILSTAGSANSIGRTDQLRIYFGTSATRPAIEVSIISCSSCSSASPTFVMDKFTFDADSGRAVTSNNFCSTVAGGPTVNTNVGPSRVFDHSATLVLNIASCGNDNVASSDNPVLARIRLLYNNASVPVAVQAFTSGGAAKVLPDQGSIITSVGSTPSGVNRKLTVTRLYPALPAIFDYVLYNGSKNQPLSKP